MNASKPRTVPGRPAWNELRRLAVFARGRMPEGHPAQDGEGDWDPADIADAITAVEVAGWPFRRALAEVSRMLADPDATPAELRAAIGSSTRPAGGHGLTAEEREELKAEALAACAAATEQHKHPTGPMPVLSEGRDP